MQHPMRQSRRAILDTGEIARILEQSDVCHLGLADGNQPYVVPLNYGYRLDGSNLTLYFHCAADGRKLDIIKRNNQACFQMDCDHELRLADRACGYSMNYASIIGSGPIERVDDPVERLLGLQLLMRHYSSRDDWAFAPENLARTTILRLQAVDFSGKALKKP
jgi:uncharacterized protein